MKGRKETGSNWIERRKDGREGRPGRKEESEKRISLLLPSYPIMKGVREKRERGNNK